MSIGPAAARFKSRHSTCAAGSDRLERDRPLVSFLYVSEHDIVVKNYSTRNICIYISIVVRSSLGNRKAGILSEVFAAVICQIRHDGKLRV